MADIRMRFHKDMMVLSGPIEPILAGAGMDISRDFEFSLLFENDLVADALKLLVTAGATALVLPTAGITAAQLAHKNMDADAPALANAALEAAREALPQHIIAEIGPCGLPFDGSLKPLLLEHRDQYSRVARLFLEAISQQANAEAGSVGAAGIDAFLLNGFGRADTCKCALMGLQKVCDTPVFACFNVRADGQLADGRDTLEDALAMAVEYGASVVGFATSAGLNDACALARRAAAACAVPLMVQLNVAAVAPKQLGPTPENPYYCADTMVDAACQLRSAGVQFLRAGGAATPAYTGALAAATWGFDVFMPNAAHTDAADGAHVDASLPTEAPTGEKQLPNADELAALRAQVAQALFSHEAE